MSEFDFSILDEINVQEEGGTRAQEEEVIVIDDDDEDNEMEGVENGNTEAEDAERERRYREYMNESLLVNQSFNNQSMYNSGIKSREESEYDEIHEFINEVINNLYEPPSMLSGGHERQRLKNRRRHRSCLEDDDPLSTWDEDRNVKCHHQVSSGLSTRSTRLVLH